MYANFRRLYIIIVQGGRKFPWLRFHIQFCTLAALHVWNMALQEIKMAISVIQLHLRFIIALSAH